MNTTDKNGAEINVGDIVTMNGNSGCAEIKSNKEYVVESVPKGYSGTSVFMIYDPDEEMTSPQRGCHCNNYWTIVRKFNQTVKTKNMASLKDLFRLAFKAEPERSFQKAQITNGSDELTTDGQTVFLGWLLKKHGAEFKTEVIDPILEQMDKEGK